MINDVLFFYYNFYKWKEEKEEDRWNLLKR